MNVKEAVAVAKKYIADLYSEEEIANIGLEEVEFDRKTHVWDVTVGFSRPWDGMVGGFSNRPARARSYKVVRVSDADGRVRSVKDRLAFVA